MATTNLYKPYIITELTDDVLLRPHQMDNKMYLHLKANLERNLVNKCYKKYGFILEIISLKEITGGIIEAENTESSALFNAKFICKICIALRKRQIICKVDKITNLIITLSNGPILVIVPVERLNTNVFFRDTSNALRYKTNNDTKILKPGDLVIVTLSNVEMYDRGSEIKAIGIADNIASDDQIKKYYDINLQDNNTEVINYDEFVN